MNTLAVRMRNGLAAALALAVAAMPLVSFAASETLLAAPDPAPPSANLTAQIEAGAFAATIMPARGYAGPRFIGVRPVATKVATPATTLGGRLSPQVSTTQQLFYPADMGYYGGPTVPAAQQVNIYWGEPNGSTWGNPATYEAALNASPMITLLDAYTFQPQASGDWPVAASAWTGGTVGTYVSAAQVAAKVQSVAALDRAAGRQALGFSTIYHLFLPPGVDTCFSPVSQGCYSPDGKAPGKFAFCAYHSYTTLSDGTVVLYTVEPYQSVRGCSSGYGAANDTANVLGHETAETISDPLPGTGWYGEWDANSGEEIGDVCAWTIVTQTLNGATYHTQNWYSNTYHGCANRY